jgi:hypothetical protein
LLTRIFAQALGDQAVQAIETLAQVTRLHRQENLKPARKTQHGAFSHARSNAAAIVACFSLEHSSVAPEGKRTTTDGAAAGATEGPDLSTTASSHCTGPVGDTFG